MKKVLTGLMLATAFLLAGCSAKSEFIEYEELFARQGYDEKNSTETTLNFNVVDTSDLTSTFAGRSDFKMQNGSIVTKISSGTASGGTVSNWMFTNLGMNITGFEANLKCGSNMNRCGFEWKNVTNNNAAYDMYWFNISSDGKFRIDYYEYKNSTGTWSTIKEFSTATSKVDVTKINRIKVRTTDSEKTEVFMNGNLMYTIEKADLKITPGVIAISYQLKNGMTYSSSNVAEAGYKILSVQKKK